MLDQFFNSFKESTESIHNVAFKACDYITSTVAVPQEDQWVQMFNYFMQMWTQGVLPDTIMLHTSTLYDPKWTEYLTCIIDTIKLGGLGA